MRRIIYLVFIFAAVCCKQKTSPSADGPITYKEFAEIFPLLDLPYSVSDTNFYNIKDTTHIPRNVTRQFVPDSVFTPLFGKDTSYTIKAIGKLNEEEKEDYLTVYAYTKQKAAVYLLVFNDDKFSTAMPLVVANKEESVQTATVDKKLSVVINKEWAENNKLMFDRTIYAYNNVGVFTTVLTETNMPRIISAGSVINPIDTFAQQNKFSGDYAKGKKNFISIRDGDRPDTYLFFVHFTNDNENPCGGDLKGELKMTSESEGIYNDTGDPCKVDFIFTKNTVRVKEQGSCGNHRGITCIFNDTYTKKKQKR